MRKRPAGVRPSPVGIDPNGLFNIIYSSGTTGEPKGIVHSHQMRWMQLQNAGAVGGYGPSTVTIISTPLYSNNAHQLLADNRLWRLCGTDGEIRSGRILTSCCAASCDKRDARTGPVPLDHGRAGL